MDPFQQPKTAKKLFLVTGGHGFLGSHLALRLFEMKIYTIQVVDIAPEPAITGPICHEVIRGDLCDMALCEYAVKGVDTVIHFAANMGGMGTIHNQNDFQIYEENHRMTINILHASVGAGVKCFMYASSACVYPEFLQCKQTGDISLRESEAWTHLPPKPQGLYGLEKFNSEILIQQFASSMDIRIARFHNVFGPGGTWNDGREKAPAAMLRKAMALNLRDNPADAKFEIWGDGTQRRSFLYVSDAVDGIMALLSSSYSEPLNIGSNDPVTIQALANIAVQCAGMDPTTVVFSNDCQKPIGVASRNSNNELTESVLGWKSRVSLSRGMQLTGKWIERQITNSLNNTNKVPHDLLTSKVVDLRPNTITFAILLPITSRGTSSPSESLDNLRQFARSLLKTTWRDTRDLRSGVTFRFAIYLAIDKDDEFLLHEGDSDGKAQKVLRDEGIFHIVTIYCDYPRGHVCKIWRDCAKKAWIDRCDYMVLMGDDIVLEDEGWMREAHSEFAVFADEIGVPKGFGCIAFTDISFPGMPTFPIVHKTHMDVFGEVIPEVFVNQGGDPFLFQLYRRWNCSKMFSSRISNGVGGEGEARYTKHAEKWKFDILDEAVSTAERWLHGKACSVNKVITIDVVIPCYRVDLQILDVILSLKPSPTCTVMFIIIVDDPLSPRIYELQRKYSARADVRIRVNKINVGASASRNRGMEESAADWIHFLDDDIVPNLDLLEQDEKAIRSEPQAAGFVGKSIFPVADSVFTAAVHLAGVTYFWGIAAEKNLANDVPWGVTANLITRREKDDIQFDLRYPKTGGGEDIHYCRLKRRFSLQNKRKGFIAAPMIQVTHPWWNKGSRSYWRFHNWSVGDGGLIQHFPELVYTDYAPNSAELALFCVFGFTISIILRQPDLFLDSFKAFASVIISNISHDYYRHMYKHPERTLSMNTTLIRSTRSSLWRFTVVESTVIRMFSEAGRLRGMLSRKEYFLLGKRFDWFAGRLHNSPIMEERLNNIQRAVLAVCIFLVLSRL